VLQIEPHKYPDFWNNDEMKEITAKRDVDPRFRKVS
jgi:hypothetical protein